MTRYPTAVLWKDAKVQPADLPEAVKPPRWLMFVFAGIVGLRVLLMLRRRKKREVFTPERTPMRRVYHHE